MIYPLKCMFLLIEVLHTLFIMMQLVLALLQLTKFSLNVDGQGYINAVGQNTPFDFLKIRIYSKSSYRHG